MRFSECIACLKVINIIPTYSIIIYIIAFYNSNPVGYGLRLGKNWWEYCNKQALICNKLRTVSKFGGDTDTFRKI